MPLDMSGQELTDAYAAAWGMAVRHLHAAGQGRIAWVRANLHEPLIVHLSFRVGNQLYFVFVDVEGGLPWHGPLKSLFLDAAATAGAHACRLPVTLASDEEKTPSPAAPGWGLLDARSGAAVDPFALESDEHIELSDWEVHDLAVQIVRDQMQQLGLQVQSWHSYLGVFPAIWFEQGEDVGWVVVSARRWPNTDPERPPNSDDMKRRFPGTGYFVSVVLASDEQDMDSPEPLPVFRGHPFQVSCSDLEPL